VQVGASFDPIVTAIDPPLEAVEGFMRTASKESETIERLA
jgi:hypothetical protein